MTTTETLVAPSSARGRRRNRDRGLILLAAPSTIWYLIFTIGPLFAMFYIAFLDWEGLAAKPTWAGWANFERMFTDDRILNASVNTAIHLFATLPIMMLLSFMLGYFLNLRLPGHRILRVILFIPALISISALGMLFVAVLGPVGLVNGFLTSAGLPELARAWLADPSTAMICLIVVTIWSGTGFNAILFSARLSGIDEDIYAAADLDGAGHWQKMWGITFPIALDYFGVLTMLQFLWTFFGTAGLILILTQGGPGRATETLSWLVFRFGYEDADVGYSQAIGILLFVVGVIGLLVIRRFLRARY
ncbi:carbohydrate ABC transporter permease [Microbacterium immunditiarum]|uniref:Multiple sugar transport system permease protein n=1 Tax=Microbacterium immunditiarum TaxID=337480 RepID=A0A7Y9GM36_9MICO|nr:sugar ABC transporter permease [Microbacterium immunditiarum]NYE19020.1 multiple sugar transport system permease protein [Microbacterium immunditiarum]